MENKNETKHFNTHQMEKANSLNVLANTWKTRTKICAMKFIHIKMYTSAYVYVQAGRHGVRYFVNYNSDTQISVSVKPWNVVRMECIHTNDLGQWF